MLNCNHAAVEESTRQLTNQELVSKLKMGLGNWLTLGIQDHGEQIMILDGNAEDLTWSETIALMVLLERSLETRMSKRDWVKMLQKHSSNLVYKPEPKERMGYVYLMKNHRSGMFKIGFSKAPKYREKTLQSEEPEIEMLHHFKGTMEDEKDLHAQFADKRVRGEWFSLTQEEVDALLRF